MNIQRQLFWHQGLFLQPQHFQLLDSTFRSLFAPYQHFSKPHFWGAGCLEINKSSLRTGVFSIESGSFLFFDGTYAVIPGNALLESRPFNEDWIEGGKPLTVYVGVRKWNSNGANVTVLPVLENIGSVITQFVAASDPDEVTDLHAGGQNGQVKRMSYALKLFWGTELEQLGDYQLIPIAQLERFGAEIRLSVDFVPPCLVVAASDTLQKLIREIRDQITSRSHQLEEFKSKRGVQSAEFGSRDMVYLLALRSLNRYVPLLFHAMETEQVHPWDVYGLLRQLVGELSSFSERVNVLGELEDGRRIIPGYDHRNLWGCFSALQELLSHLLDEITAGPEYTIRLMPDGVRYMADLKPAIFEGTNRYYLALKTDEEPRLVLQSLETAAKLSSREHLELIATRALPGIELEHIPVPPQELPRRAHTLYFAVNHHNEQWASVVRNHNVALYWDNAPTDVSVELMVVGRG